MGERSVVRYEQKALRVYVEPSAGEETGPLSVFAEKRDHRVAVFGRAHVSRGFVEHIVDVKRIDERLAVDRDPVGVGIDRGVRFPYRLSVDRDAPAADRFRRLTAAESAVRRDEFIEAQKDRLPSSVTEKRRDQEDRRDAENCGDRASDEQSEEERSHESFDEKMNSHSGRLRTFFQASLFCLNYIIYIPRGQ